MRYLLKRKERKPDNISMETIFPAVVETFRQILRENPYESSLSREEIKKRLDYKKTLRIALKNCAFGDSQSKTYVKEFIKEILVRKFGVNRYTIEGLLAVSKPEGLSAQDKFEILLYWFKKEYGREALERMLEDYGLDRPSCDEEGNSHYEITADQIEELYDCVPVSSLHFNDRLNILAQRIYENYRGSGIIDEIKDMKIDGVSGGVSGIPEGFLAEEQPDLSSYPKSYDSVWIFYKGKSIHFSFLSFQSQKELIRVCKNIYRYNNPGQLSEASGYMINEMKDGSRVAVARPPFCESWVFFIRKFDSVIRKSMDTLITDTNSELPIRFIRWLVKGCQVIGITGEQGSGKTTLLMAMISYINPAYNLRIQELSFELHLRKIYPNRNIVTFRETDTVSGQAGLDFQKKTDGTVSILGEVASAGVSAWLVQMAQVASAFTLFTHHARTTDHLIAYLRNALLKEGGFRDEIMATDQVTSAIRFDIHMKKDVDGHRYIERITEIIPNPDLSSRKRYEARDIIIFQGGRYEKRNPLSREVCGEIMGFLKEGEQESFQEEVGLW